MGNGRRFVCAEKTKEWWESCNITCSPDYVLMLKLKELKGDIRRWNREEFGRLENRTIFFFGGTSRDHSGSRP